MNINWQTCFLNIRAAGISTRALSKRIHMDPTTVQHFYRGELREPKFSQGLAALDMHLAVCPDKHHELVR